MVTSEKMKPESSTCLNMRIAGSLHLTNYSASLATAIKRKLELPNQSYQQAIKRNPRARYTLSPVVKYYEEKGKGENRELVVPRGVLNKLRRFLEQRGEPFIEQDERIVRPIKFKTSIVLRPYQQGVDDTIAQSYNGIVRCDPGYGKSLLALRVIEKIGQRTLIIVPTKNILNQFKYDIKKYAGFSAGIIQADNFSIKDVTVATWASLTKRVNEARLSDKEFGCIIVDECHGSVTTNRRRTLAMFRSRFLYGLTATARRTDGQGRAIEWIFGPILIEGKVKRASPEVELVLFKGHIWVQEYADMIAEQTENEERNQLIVDIIHREIDAGRKILVLTKRIKHYERLKELIEREGVHAVNAKDASNSLAQFKSDGGSFSCLLGTFHLLGTGVDIPILDTLIIAGDLKSDVLAEQSVGRILRLLSGKNKPKIIDIQDKGNGILRNQAKLREVFYREQGWVIQ